MKLRIKYSKLGSLRFIGHLDVMRYFQKEIKRSGIRVAYSKGYSPHQIISFAAPLAMGITSEGEYFDGEFEEITTSKEMIDALNAVSVPEIIVTDCVLLPETAKTAMSVVSASDYRIRIKDGMEASQIFDGLCSFLNQDAITILKKTKKSEKEEDIKPGILVCRLINDEIYMLLQTGSVYNLKPELVMEALYKYCGLEYDFLKLAIHRLETYMTQDDEIIPLSMAGEHF